MRKLIALLSAIAISLVGGLPSHAAPYVAPQYVEPDDYVGINFVESFSSTGEASSFIYNVVDSTVGEGANNDFEQFWCPAGHGKAPCDFVNTPNSNVHGQVLAPVCKDKAQINCIESVAVYKAGSTSEPASLIREIGGEIIQANTAQNLSLGGTKSIWSSPVLHDGGSGQYSAYVALGLAFDKKTAKFSIAQLTATVQPTTEKFGEYSPTKYQEFTNDQGLTRVGGSAGPSECVWLDNGSCGVLEDFAPDTRVSLTIRLSKSVGGWFKGRMVAPTIKVEKYSSTANRVTVDATPAKVPMVTGLAPRDSTDPGILKLLTKDPFLRDHGGLVNMRSDSSWSIDNLELFRNVMQDRASGVNTIWSVGTAPGGIGGGACLSDTSRLLGLVTTNATTYEGSAPNFANGTLSYKVAGMHYMPDGVEVFRGSYDLVMRSDVARCLYGFTTAPVRASVSVMNSGGEKTAATTVVSEKGGWLKMSANNFTFSKKTIKIKLTGTKKK